MTTTAHREHIEQVVATIQERWGTQALQRLGEVTTHTEGIPTGYAALDMLLGDGVARGAVTCLSGALTSGKTALALDVLARVQQDDGVTIYLDTTGALDPEYAEKRGVDLEHLLIVWPQPPVLGLEIARDIVTRDGADLLGWHTLGAVAMQPAAALLDRFGKQGRVMHRPAGGAVLRPDDARVVHPARV